MNELKQATTQITILSVKERGALQINCIQNWDPSLFEQGWKVCNFLPPLFTENVKGDDSV